MDTVDGEENVDGGEHESGKDLSAEGVGDEALRAAADRKHTIVYVEADGENRRLVVEVLEITGAYRIISTGDGVSGLELIKEHQPVIAVVDLDLPVISAFELLRRVRNSGPPISRTPLVALSASVMKGERQRCLRAGFMAFMEKPFDIKELRTKIAECVRRSPTARQTVP